MVNLLQILPSPWILAGTGPKQHLSEFPSLGGAVTRFLLYAPAILWAALLLFVGGRSNVPAVETDLPLDKAAHFVTYGILGVLVTIGWLRTGRPKKLFWLLLLALLVGVIDELHQLYVPGRSADVLDWFADALGIGVAATLVRRYIRGSSNVV